VGKAVPDAMRMPEVIMAVIASQLVGFFPLERSESDVRCAWATNAHALHVIDLDTESMLRDLSV
jgi:hypothetical protein